jgi:hypothetical protein
LAACEFFAARLTGFGDCLEARGNYLSKVEIELRPPKGLQFGGADDERGWPNRSALEEHDREIEAEAVAYLVFSRVRDCSSFGPISESTCRQGRHEARQSGPCRSLRGTDRAPRQDPSWIHKVSGQETAELIIIFSRPMSCIGAPGARASASD